MQVDTKEGVLRVSVVDGVVVLDGPDGFRQTMTPAEAEIFSERLVAVVAEIHKNSD